MARTPSSTAHPWMIPTRWLRCTRRLRKDRPLPVPGHPRATTLRLDRTPGPGLVTGRPSRGDGIPLDRDAGRRHRDFWRDRPLWRFVLGRVGGLGTGHDSGPDSSPGYPELWPFEVDPEEHNEVHTGKEGRGWLRVAILVAVLLVLVVAMAIAFNRGRQDGSPSQGSEQCPATSSKAKSSPVKIAGVTDFDPYADPPEENPDTAKNAIDGNSATSWMTSTYRGDPALGGLKPGVGLMLDLARTPRRSR